MWYECKSCEFFFEELKDGLCYECHNEWERNLDIDHWVGLD